MKKMLWTGLLLEALPIVAFVLLGVLHHVGDPQASGNLLVRILDYQGTYFIRHALPVPPPLLLVGVCLVIPIWVRGRSAIALAGSIAGIALLGLWTLIMVVPLLVHVN